MEYLSKKDLEALFLTIRDKGPLQDGTWQAARATLNPGYQGALPTSGNAAAELMLQLTDINRTERLVDGTVPIEVVLGSLKLQSTRAVVVELVAALLARIEGATGPGAPPGGTLEYTAPQPEAYVGERDDMLPFDFMERGYRTGRSVARLVVRRFEDGKAAIPGNGAQRTFLGTGWMVTPNLFITNFHVVCARESDEGDPTDADLALQVAATEIQLDFDREDAIPRSVKDVELVAHGARGGKRDYALLRVKQLPPPDRWPAALRLRLEPPAVPDEGYSVNIIQHPQGWPKRIAMRSNLLKRATPSQLEYFGDTLGGSSGSPLCNDAWEVIGLHLASGPATNVMVNGRTAVAYNVGIPIAAIIDDLKATNAAVAKELDASIIR